MLIYCLMLSSLDECRCALSIFFAFLHQYSHLGDILIILEVKFVYYIVISYKEIVILLNSKSRNLD